MSKPGLTASARERLGQLLRTGEPVFTPERTASARYSSRLHAAQRPACWAKAGWLARVRRGVYVPIPLVPTSADVRLHEPWSVGTKLYAACPVGGWSALEDSGLAEQTFRSV